MAKRIEKDGKFYRMRRGKLVEIPPEWLGKDTHRETIRGRPSSKIHKMSKWFKKGKFRYRTSKSNNRRSVLKDQLEN